MDTVEYLLKFFFKLAIALTVAAFVWWLVTILYPSLSIKNLFFSNSDQGWLPAPGSVGSLLGQRDPPSAKGNVYVPGPAYNGYANSYNNNNGGAKVDFISYTPEGIEITRYGQNTQTISSSNPSGYEPRSLYIRNLSIYQGGSIYTGISFLGEARADMFNNGRFPIIIVDNNGRVATVATAVATNEWSVPGWVRFRVKIDGVMPIKTPCTMVFQSGNASLTVQPVRVAMPITCN